MKKVDFLAVTTGILPSQIHGAHSKCSIRLLSAKERIAIEDHFFMKGHNLQIDSASTAVVISQVFADHEVLSECSTLVEFALSMLTLGGFESVKYGASFVNGACVDAYYRESFNLPNPALYATSIEGAAAAKWLGVFLNAHVKIPDRMHITAGRFVRYSEGFNVTDALMDLCICLESLLDSQSEVSFRFGVYLTKVTGAKGAEAARTAKLLSSLYELRSKLAHGDPGARKSFEKLEPSLAELRKIARVVLTKYVLFLSEHSRNDWKEHLHKLLYD